MKPSSETERAGGKPVISDKDPAATHTTAPLPRDLREAWAGAEQEAGIMLGAWGEDRFRQSAMHRMASYEHERAKKLEHLRAAYLKAAKAHK